MMLSDEEIKAIIKSVVKEFSMHVPDEDDSENFHVEERMAPVLIENGIRAVLAKASQQVQGDDESDTNYCALKTITDDQVKKVVRAFWRRIYCYRNDYGIELPDPLPAEFVAHMATALTWVDKEPEATPTPTPKQEPVAVMNEKGDVMTRIQCNDDAVFEICCRVQKPLYDHPSPAQAAAIPDREYEIDPRNGDGYYYLYGSDINRILSAAPTPEMVRITNEDADK